MGISVNWLRELVPGLDEPVEALAERLSLRAVAVEEMVPVGAGLEDIRVARVLEVRRHPDADRLWLCRVDSGESPVDVVCGAPVVEEGALYPYVPPGATLPGGMAIESREIRGVVSHGMLCSERELGLGRDRGGIMKLAAGPARDGLAPGRPLAAALGLPDTRLVLDLTPNRVDLACHVGVARELAPEGDAGIVLRETGGPGWSPEWRDGAETAEAAGVRVTIEDPDRCPRYLGAVIRGVEPGPSPPWLAGRLRAAGMRPVNNVVDATNYVLLELNQPIHAFDLARLRGGEVRIGPGSAGEKLTTLDGEERETGPETTVIADAGGPVALAGVMGGEESEVSASTTDLFIECASFGPRAVRRTARATGLSTEASYRFERGIDERGPEAALVRCVELILALAGGEAATAAIRAGGPPPERAVVRLRRDRVRRVLGIDPGAFELRRLLRPIGFEAADGEGGGAGDGADVLAFRVPGWRRDVTREIDLVEEVARRFGYENFPDEPRRVRPGVVPADPSWARAGRVRELLVGRGLLEARSSPFVPRRQPGGRAEVAVSNPLSAEEGHLRAGIVPLLLRRLEHNWARERRDVRLFEIGTAFGLAGAGAAPGARGAGKGGERADGGGAGEDGGAAGGADGTGRAPSTAGRPRADVAAALPRDAAVTRETHAAVLSGYEEELRVGAVLSGRSAPRHWSEDGRDLDVWDLKGLAAEIAEVLCGGHLEPLAGPGPRDFLRGGDWLSGEGFRIVRDGETVGVAGGVVPEAVDAPPWAGPVWALELRLAAVEPAPPRSYRPVSPYPAVRRDLAVTVPRGLPAAEVEAGIRGAAPESLEAVELFDVYEGEGIDPSRRSLAWAFRFRAPDRTLTDDEVEEAMRAIISELETECDARVRSA